MMQKSAVCSLLLSLAPLLARASATAPTQPDTTRTTIQPRRHVLKLGLQGAGNAGTRPSLGYEWLLQPHLSLQTSLSYTGSTWYGGFDYVNPDHSLTSTRFTDRERRLGLSAEARYYFRRQPALTGWYAGAALSSLYTHVQRTYTTSPTILPDETTHTLSLTPGLRLGRQWALGQRLVLDTYLGAHLQPRSYYYGTLRQPWQAAPVLGFSLGYRF